VTKQSKGTDSNQQRIRLVQKKKILKWGGGRNKNLRRELNGRG